MWKWILSLFTKPTYKITVSYDTKFGNSDDKTWEGVKTISKKSWKELKFITSDKRQIEIRSNGGLHYSIEQEE
jgi:hypothetical protein